MNISSSAPHDHPEVKFGKIGVLILNLGTPDGYDFFSLRRYLKEFLLDKRVIELPSWQWWPILFGIILNIRPQKIKHAYAQIWNTSQNESILRTHTRNQAINLAKSLENIPSVIVDWSMRYGKPSVDETIDSLTKKGCNRIILFPLYPQYSAATIATAQDKVFQKLMKMRWTPSLRVVPPYYDNPDYISALTHSVNTHLESLQWEPEILLASFHGMPLSYCLKGDPYRCHCHKTARLLKESLSRTDANFKITFQSRFGASEWLQPYTDKTIQQLAHSGIKRIAIITPGFSSDCLETNYEIAHEVKEIFIQHGGQEFTHIPCLNSSNLGIDLLEKIIRRELMGWI
ncbi:ferrochelatase [Candidatus Liberibacter solanacearum]|uniref:Ferrochelatase n=1 Tax=Candidatus Liberibacter solanacearum TaxID=556287 RepID=A0A095BEA3_9HYPH|nr:ferrochelatase [Candidatus Liberibacter solanacearum]KGB27153.1 ferrochelatase [Candidatus Liberibacter solanacearum]KJZ81254.1 ferrochelatase [Candidatus Liberibacter solanacearum]KJZ81746.1 Ferrochelatase, protoheme ferro-lyase [Candidatus Liberibacter solanacearum]KQC49019.1 ferrochelatase [Candidatus Liberibacter solanacearum]